jgi:hypothetical protein
MSLAAGILSASLRRTLHRQFRYQRNIELFLKSNWHKLKQLLPESCSRFLENQRTHFILHYSFFILSYKFKIELLCS